jgi:hypothetical protein
MTTAAALVTLDSIRQFILAGSAVFTVVSKVTGARKTFKVSEAKDRIGFYFVSLLNGPDNTSDYKYLGALFVRSADGSLGFKLNKEKWGKEAGAAFEWLLKSIATGSPKFAEQAEFWHEGRCGKCGRALTTPESIAQGLGPVCAGRAGGEE